MKFFFKRIWYRLTGRKYHYVRLFVDGQDIPVLKVEIEGGPKIIGTFTGTDYMLHIHKVQGGS